MGGYNPIGATSDNMLEFARGHVTGIKHSNVGGVTTNADSDVATDIWDGANSTDDTDIWIAPTTARTHAIVSASTSDDGDPAGVGARTIKIYGLTSWDLTEATETITMNGTTDVNTASAYVIIYKMEVLTKGATSSNVGKITATAATDGTITAMILANEGQTEMAICAIPSIETGFLTDFHAGIEKAAGGSHIDVDVKLLVNPEPNNELTNFINKAHMSLAETGTSRAQTSFRPFLKVVGPAIIKVQAKSNTADSEVGAGFDLIVVTN